MGKVIDTLSEKAISLVSEAILNSIKGLKKNDLWKKAVMKACKATEGVDVSFSDYIVESLAIQRHFVWLTSNKSLDDIYHSFIITIAVELCAFNTEKKFAVSFGTAILDNWFELNGIDYIQLKNQIIGDRIIKIVNDRERLYREYFLLYDDPCSEDVIRVYYPKNDENWIRWNKEYSIDIRINLSKGAEFGFCRIGFSYSKIKEQKDEKFLKIAYVNDDREIFRFEHDDMLGIDEKKILWVW